MKKCWKCLLVIILMTAFPSLSFAEQEILIVGALEADQDINKEPVVNFYKAWRKDFKELPEIKILPPSRLIKKFENTNYYCAFGWDIKGVKSFSKHKLLPLVESKFFRANYLFVLEKEGHPKVKTFADLKGKEIYTPYVNEFKQILKNYEVSISKAPDYDSLSKMYKTNRADYIMFDIPTQVESFKKYGIKVPKKEDRLITMTGLAGMVCTESEKTQRLIKNLNVFIEKTKKDGRYKKILGGFAY